MFCLNRHKKLMMIVVMLTLLPLNLYAAQCTTRSSIFTDEDFDSQMYSISAADSGNALYGCKGTYRFPKIKGKMWTEWNLEDIEYVIGILKEAKADRDVCGDGTNGKDEFMLAKLSCLQATAAQNNNHSSASKNSSNAIVSNSKGKNKNHNSAKNQDANSDNSNSSDTNHQTRPNEKRVNLNNDNRCISLGDPHKQKPTSNTSYFFLKNSCAYPLQVSWCSGRGCKNLNSATTISGGESYESWTHISQNGMVNLNWIACQLRNGNNEIYLDHKTGHCWTNVEMQ